MPQAFKAMDDPRLAELVRPFLLQKGIDAALLDDGRLAMCGSAEGPLRHAGGVGRRDRALPCVGGGFGRRQGQAPDGRRAPGDRSTGNATGDL